MFLTLYFSVGDSGDLQSNRLLLGITLAIERQLGGPFASSAGSSTTSKKQRQRRRAITDALKAELEAAQATLVPDPEQQLTLPELQRLLLSHRAKVQHAHASAVLASPNPAYADIRAFAFNSVDTGLPATAFGLTADKLPADTLACYCQLIGWEPRNPRHPLEVADACDTLPGVKGFCTKLRFLEQPVTVAERANRPYWLAAAAYELCSRKAKGAAAGACLATLAELAALAEQGDAALRRCKRFLPQVSCAPLQRRREAELAPLLARLERASFPAMGRIQPGQSVFHVLVNVSRSAREAAPPEGPKQCSSCGKPSLELRKCGGCRQAAYCSRDCQLAVWKGHKAACRAATAGSRT